MTTSMRLENFVGVPFVEAAAVPCHADTYWPIWKSSWGAPPISNAIGYAKFYSRSMAPVLMHS
jgi:hypothetical protein